MESGRPFSIDERLYPEFVSGWQPRPIDQKYNPPSHARTEGKATIWENGPFRDMFDKVSALCTFDLYPSSTASLFNFVVWISVILRRILRTVRARVPISQKFVDVGKWWSEAIAQHPPSVRCAFMELPRNVNIESLHNSLLLFFETIPDRARAFPSLEIFVEWKDNYPETDPFFMWTMSAPCLEGTLLFLSSFCYLHIGALGSMESNVPKYKLSLSHTNFNAGGQYYSSRQIIFVTLKALCFLIKKLGSQLSSELPSPSQYWAVEPLVIFIISSSGLLATRVSPFNENDFRLAHHLISQFVMPLITKLARLWPVAAHYKSKLESIMNNVNT